MKFLFTKTGISVIALVGLFVFGGLMMSGVLGSTQIGLTLRTNADLERGLVGHWTFDKDDVNGFLVSDSSGNGNHGSIVATSTQAEVELYTTSGTAANRGHSPTHVWTSDDDGYVFFVSNAQDAHLASTTDSGASWSVRTSVDSVNSDVIRIAVWDDSWTNGFENTGSIHIATQESSNDSEYYTHLNTNTGALSTSIEAGINTSANFSGTHSNAIVRAENGTLYVASHNNSANSIFGYCSSNCTSAASWTNTQNAGVSAGFVSNALVPIVGTDKIMNVYYNSSDSDIESNIFDPATNSWEGITTIDFGALGAADTESSMGVTYDPTTGTIYIVFHEDVNDYTTQDHDLSFWSYTEAGGWVQRTDVVTDASGGLDGVALSLDRNRGTIYAAYVRRTTIGTATTGNIYYKTSDDGGVTWSSEIGPVNEEGDADFNGPRMPMISDERISISYVDDASDLQVALIRDIGDYEDEKTVPGNIGQGMEFDGSNDYVEAPDSLSLDFDSFTAATWAAWIKADVLTAAQGDDMSFMSHWNDPAGNRPYQFYVDSPTDRISIAVNGSIVASSTEAIIPRDWYHAVAVWDNSDYLRLYVNGVLVDENTSSIPATLQTNTAGNFIGARQSATVDEFFNGQIDDVRIYSRALSASEVERLYGLGATTKINKTLRTNPDLENGLVGHWTFDREDVDGFTVSDRSGSGNDGVIVATSTQGEIEVHDDAEIDSNDYHEVSGSQTVWVTDQRGYIFFTDDGADLVVASTTDGGASWSSVLDLDTDTSKVAVWYDRWTPEKTSGSIIHLSLFSASADELYYIAYDTADDTFNARIQTTSGELGNATLSAGQGFTQGRDGTLYMTMADNTGNVAVRCSLACTNASNWSSIGDPYDAEDVDQPSFIPLTGTDNVALLYINTGSDTIDLNIYSATSSSWWGVRTLEADGPTADGASNFGSTYNPYTGEIYVFHTADINDYVTQDHDFRVFTLNPSTLATSSLTDVITNASGGLNYVKLAVDTNREDHLYAIYDRYTTISDASTNNVYYKVSTDGGVTWSSEVGPVNTTVVSDTLTALGAPLIADERISVYWIYNDAAQAADLYVTTIADIGDYEDEKQVVGNIGQGMEFDGVDDHVNVGAATGIPIGSAERTVAIWFSADSFPTDFTNVMFAFTADIFDGDNLYFGAEDNTVSVAYANSRYIGPKNTLSANTWNHAALVIPSGGVNASQARLYINGVEVVQTLESGSDLAITTDTIDLFIGSSNIDTSFDEFFDGRLDDFRVYDRALSAPEISRLYQLGATTKVNTTIETNPDLNSGLIGHWTFDGKDIDTSALTAEILDRSSGGNNGDWQLHATNTVPGVLGQAIDLDGTDDIVRTTNTVATLTYPATFAGWLKTTDSDRGFIVVHGRENSSRCEYGIMVLNTGEARLATDASWSQDGTGFNSTTTVNDGEWHHVAGVMYSGNTGVLYVDGNEESSGAVAAVCTGMDYYRLGHLWSDGVGAAKLLDGSIDDVRIYNRALSASEILRLYQQGQ